MQWGSAASHESKRQECGWSMWLERVESLDWIKVGISIMLHCAWQKTASQTCRYFVKKFPFALGPSIDLHRIENVFKELVRYLEKSELTGSFFSLCILWASVLLAASCFSSPIYGLRLFAYYVLRSPLECVQAGANPESLPLKFSSSYLTWRVSNAEPSSQKLASND